MKTCDWISLHYYNRKPYKYCWKLHNVMDIGQANTDNIN